MLHKTSSRSTQIIMVRVLMGSHRVACHPHFYTRKGRATPGNLHPKFSTAVTHCLLIATHFTYPREGDSLCQTKIGKSHFTLIF